MSASQTMAMAESSTPVPARRSSYSDTQSCSMKTPTSQGEVGTGSTRKTDRKATPVQAASPTSSTGISQPGACRYGSRARM